MAKEEPKAAEQPVEGAPAPAKPKLPLLIGMVAVGLAVGGGTGAVVLGPMIAKKMGKSAPAVAAAGKGADGEQAADGNAAADEAPSEGKEGETVAEAPIHLLDNLVLNPANSGGSRFLLLTVAIELNKAAVAEQFKARDAELRDLILTSLGNKSVEQLTDIALREKFKTEVIDAVEARFGKKTIKRLYFPQFVVQ